MFSLKLFMVWFQAKTSRADDIFRSRRDMHTRWAYRDLLSSTTSLAQDVAIFRSLGRGRIHRCMHTAHLDHALGGSRARAGREYVLRSVTDFSQHEGTNA